MCGVKKMKRKLYTYENSYKELERAELSRPGGVPPTRRPEDKTSPVFLIKGKGSHVWDIDNNEYIDYKGALGPIILGYGNKEIDDKVKEQIDDGFLFSLSHPIAIKLQEKLIDIFHTDRVILTKTGSEATQAAIRLARIYTNRFKILRCGYHGWHDWCIQGYGTVHYSVRQPSGFIPNILGIPSVKNIVYNYDGGDFSYVEDLFKKEGKEFACFIVDPSELQEPIEKKLRQIKELTQKYNIVFIMDEIKTAFRISLAGVQSYYNIKPDLTTISKAMANGYSISAVLGKKEIMEQKAHIHGTFIGDILPMIATLKTIEILQRDNNIKKLWLQGEKLINGVNEAIKELKMEEEVIAESWQWPPMPHIWVKKEEIRKEFYRLITGWGILMCSGHPNYINLSHSDEDIIETIEVCKEALKECSYMM